MADSSIDAIVTDPPYGLSNTDPKHVAETLTKWVTGDHEYTPPAKGGFMGKTWDSFVPPPAVWVECMRVLKPGGHLLVFAGTRTQDLMGLSIRLAGFDIRDSIGWIYGSGFPKSMDVSKAIDKLGQGEMRRGKLIHFATAREIDGKWLQEQGVADARSFADWTIEGHSPSERNWALIRDALGVTPEEEVAYEREVVGRGQSGPASVAFTRDSGGTYDITAPATPEAEKWAGWGTALKPAIEPVIVARKPLDGTVAGNVLEWGTGALNIEACRVESDGSHKRSFQPTNNSRNVYGAQSGFEPTNASGRWPANVLLDPDAAAAMDEQSGIAPPKKARTGRKGGCSDNGTLTGYGSGDDVGTWPADPGGGASRFFPVFKYQAKAPAKERPSHTTEDGAEVKHPTVKPLELMRWLVRLVTPPGGTVLDPFAGSGTTLEAALMEGFTPVGIEAESDYIPLIEARLSRVEDTLEATL